jgi:hypothetical protein
MLCAVASTEQERLQHLCDAYEADVSLPTIADAIIRRAKISSRDNDVRGVMSIVALLVAHPTALDELGKGESIPNSLVEQMRTAVSSDPRPPSMPARHVVEIVVGDVRAAIRERDGRFA